MASIIRSKNLNPFYLVHPNCRSDLPDSKDLPDSNDSTDLKDLPDSKDFTSVVLGDAVDGFSYKNLNEVNLSDF